MRRPSFSFIGFEELYRPPFPFTLVALEGALFLYGLASQNFLYLTKGFVAKGISGHTHPGKDTAHYSLKTNR
jgi:hypothetical protein